MLTGARRRPAPDRSLQRADAFSKRRSSTTTTVLDVPEQYTAANEQPTTTALIWQMKVAFVTVGD
ncbi:hypothetical protein T10_8960 [Trichinella papuae]|uniref:Uncharacterized protein n=1 Tax=Trichinella papuae TaxID=268474 RepID=A0A0V1MW29_9BILA|nr:hypothetical protein T10_8960 [Trichinella papuae]